MITWPPTALRKSLGKPEARKESSQSVGERQLANQRNPFYVERATGVACVLSSIIISTMIYLIVVDFFKANLLKAIRSADMLTAVLELSPLYPVQPSSSGATTNQQSSVPLVDDLAIALWLQHFRIAPSDASIEDILNDEDRLGTLVKAIRFGGHCDNAPRGTREALSMPTVERLARVAEFLSDNCSTSTGRGISERVAAELADFLADGGFSGKGLFKYALTQNNVYGGLDNVSPLANASVEEASKALKQEEALLKDIKQTDPKFAEIKKRRDEAENQLNKAKNADSYADVSATFQARLLLNRLYKLKTLQGSKESLKETPLAATESFAIALIGSIDGDPSVTKARQWLSAVWGMEQYLIFTLFLITSTLMIERISTFRWHRRQVIETLGELSAAVKKKQDGQAARDVEAEPQSSHRRQRERDVQADTAHERLLTQALQRGSQGSKTSELVDDMLRATRSDLGQVHLFGLSDERVDKVAEDLKDKIEASRLIIQWGITTLPALGFLGTVRGILIALSAIGGLGQGDSAARLAALLSVSSALGLAFATTLIALLCLMVLSYFDVRQLRSEKALVDGLRDFLNDKVLP